MQHSVPPWLQPHQRATCHMWPVVDRSDSADRAHFPQKISLYGTSLVESSPDSHMGLQVCEKGLCTKSPYCLNFFFFFFLFYNCFYNFTREDDDLQLWQVFMPHENHILYFFLTPANSTQESRESRAQPKGLFW